METGMAKASDAFALQQNGRDATCLLSQAQEVAGSGWNRIIWPFTAQAHKKNSTEIRRGPSPGRIEASLPDQVLSRFSFERGQIPAEPCLVYTNHKCCKPWDSQEADAEGF